MIKSHNIFTQKASGHKKSTINFRWEYRCGEDCYTCLSNLGKSTIEADMLLLKIQMEKLMVNISN